jgi:superfamily II DNA or RNA helicase
LHEGKIRVLVATSQLIGEGFDLPALSNLFLTTPIKFDGRVKQYAGRILRTDPGKKPPTIFDYVDRTGVLEASFRARKKAYQELGIAC